MKYSATSGITFIRGDDDAMMIALKNNVFETGDKVYFSLKNQPSDTTDILQIESTNFVSYGGVANAAVLINIPHAATINLALKSYFFDVLIEWSNATYVTVIPPTSFKLVPGGSHGTV
jgi:hypothetical protein